MVRAKRVLYPWQPLASASLTGVSSRHLCGLQSPGGAVLNDFSLKTEPFEGFSLRFKSFSQVAPFFEDPAIRDWLEEHKIYSKKPELTFQQLHFEQLRLPPGVSTYLSR